MFYGAHPGPALPDYLACQPDLISSLHPSQAALP